MRETWYVLEDGTAVHPSEVALNEDGRLSHKSGLVAIRPDGETPRSRGVDVDDPESEKQPTAEELQAAAAKATSQTTDMQPEKQPKAPRKPGYKTRKAI